MTRWRPLRQLKKRDSKPGWVAKPSRILPRTKAGARV